MRIPFTCLVAFAACAFPTHAPAQIGAEGIRFFRISGPATTTILAFRPDGSVIWTNAQPGATFTVQTTTSLPDVTNWVDYVRLPTTNGLSTNLLIDFNPPAGMALIPEGVFTIGNSAEDADITDATPSDVMVSAFYMDVNLVSYSHWRTIYDWATNAGYGFNNAGLGKAANHPVQTIDWFDTVKWCNARSQLEGLTPVYFTDSSMTYLFTNGEATPFANWSADGYRLPTEAEWEKAARGGLSGKRFPWGDLISQNLANYYSDTNYPYDLGPSGYNLAFTNGGTPYTSPVGSFQPNGYGLYDMAGNEQMWCWDWYWPPPFAEGSAYLGGTDPRGPVFGSPPGPSGPGGARVIRGGSWYGGGFWTRCAHRNNLVAPSAPSAAFGFRCVRRR